MKAIAAVLSSYGIEDAGTPQQYRIWQQGVNTASYSFGGVISPGLLINAQSDNFYIDFDGSGPPAPLNPYIVLGFRWITE